MVADFCEIKIIILKLLSNMISKEEASDWAMEFQYDEEQGKIEFNPQNKENEIWKSIQFLQGIDMKTSPTKYLHNNDDIMNFYKSLNDNTNNCS